MNDALVNILLRQEILNENCKNIEQLSRGIANIADNSFKCHYTTLILINSAMICGVSAFMNSYPKTMVVLSNVTKPIWRKSKQFILFGYNLENITYLLRWLQKYNYDNTGNFIIICQSSQTDECDEREAVKILWTHKIVNVIFVNLTDNGTGYTYDIDSFCENGPPIKVKNWDHCLKFGMKCTMQFPLKLKNLYGCPITVSTFFQPPYMQLTDGLPSGADGDLLLILAKSLNASLTIRTPWIGDGWGNREKNGNWVGSLGDLYYNLANFSMTSASITETRSEDFQMSKFYRNLKLVWVTHPKIKEASTYKLMRPFKPSSRAALFISFIIFILVFMVCRTKNVKAMFKTVKILSAPTKSLFYYFQICLGQPVAVQTKKTRILSFLLIWIFYCFLIRTFYQVHLINSLKTDVYLTNFVSIHDAIRDKYNFGGGLALKDYYIDEQVIYNNWEGVNSSDYYDIMNNLTEGKKFVLAMNLATAKHYLKQPGKKLHVLPQRIVTSPTAIFFNKFSPLVRPINKILDRLIECGILGMLFQNATTSRYIYKKK
ncbi:uncharacterized protein LOC116775533 [Danaus plexippus]|uniref:uncharacterized protein LOC116775533 n=1 Tax=Danaus plexippus TaxID=13037 RepID=UPI002AB232B7|nr:uncharacterized protein LOC116775533 [Danaus plexippus]